MTDEKKDEKKEQTPHIQINNSFFSLTDRDKRLVIADLLGFAGIQLARLEGVGVGLKDKK